MTREPRWLVRLPWRSRDQIASEFEDEIAFHYQARLEELRADGLSESEAEARAQHEFGDLDDARRYIRRIDTRTQSAARRRELLGSLRQEFRHAIQRLRRAPAFTTTAVLSLGLAAGATALVANIVWGVLLRPLPYHEADRVTMIWGHMPQIPSALPENPLSGPYFSLMRRESTTFEAIAAFQTEVTNLGDQSDPIRIDAIRATGEFFDALGVQPALGQFFNRSHEVPGGDRVVVLSDRLWRDRFRADPQIVGSTVSINLEPHTIVAVAPPGFAFPRGAEMPASFRFPERTDLWLPLVPPTDWGSFTLAFVARVRPGVTAEALRQDLDRLEELHNQELPYAKGYFGTRAVPLPEQLLGYTRSMLVSVSGAVLVLLLLACVNSAQLQIAQLLARRRELAVRAALGASTRRLLTGLLLDALCVATLATGIGMALAWGGLRVLRTVSAHRLPRLAETPFEPTAVLLALGVAAMATLLASAGAYAAGARVSVMETLRRGGRGAGSSGFGARRALIVTELALSVVLVASAGLLLRSLLRQLNTDTGFSAPDALTFELTLPPVAYPERRSGLITENPRAVALLGEALSRMRALPGVIAVGLGKPLPLRGSAEGGAIAIEGAPAPATPADGPTSGFIVASDGLLAALGTPLLAGRDFHASDRADAPYVVLVNQALAEREWPGQDPLGKRVKLGGYTSPMPWMTVIGVTANVRRYGLTQPPQPEIIAPYTQRPYPSLHEVQFIVRSSVPATTLVPLLRQTIADLDPSVPISRIRTVPELVADATVSARFSARFMAAFGGAALLLAMIGVYGVVAFSVGQRRQEFGVRQALGADRAHIIRLVASEGGRMAAVGLLVGLGGAVIGGRLLRSLLYEVPSVDPPTLAATVLILAGATALACLVPAIRAARVEPRTALEDG